MAGQAICDSLTQYEGTYSFDATAVGTSSDGTDFTRESTNSTVVTLTAENTASNGFVVALSG